MMVYTRPAIFRDAFIGTVIALFGAYVAGAALWTWLRWPGQHLDLVRLAATAFGLFLIVWGVWLIRMWLHREWFEAPERRRRSGFSDGSGGGSGGSADGGSCDGGSCGS